MNKSQMGRMWVSEAVYLKTVNDMQATIDAKDAEIRSLRAQLNDSRDPSEPFPLPQSTAEHPV